MAGNPPQYFWNPNAPPRFTLPETPLFVPTNAQYSNNVRVTQQNTPNTPSEIIWQIHNPQGVQQTGGRDVAGGAHITYITNPSANDSAQSNPGYFDLDVEIDEDEMRILQEGTAEQAAEVLQLLRHEMETNAEIRSFIHQNQPQNTTQPIANQEETVYEASDDVSEEESDELMMPGETVLTPPLQQQPEKMDDSFLYDKPVVNLAESPKAQEPAWMQNNMEPYKLFDVMNAAPFSKERIFVPPLWYENIKPVLHITDYFTYMMFHDAQCIHFGVNTYNTKMTKARDVFVRLMVANAEMKRSETGNYTAAHKQQLGKRLSDASEKMDNYLHHMLLYLKCNQKQDKNEECSILGCDGKNDIFICCRNNHKLHASCLINLYRSVLSDGTFYCPMCRDDSISHMIFGFRRFATVLHRNPNVTSKYYLREVLYSIMQPKFLPLERTNSFYCTCCVHKDEKKESDYEKTEFPDAKLFERRTNMFC